MSFIVRASLLYLVVVQHAFAHEVPPDFDDKFGERVILDHPPEDDVYYFGQKYHWLQSGLEDIKWSLKDNCHLHPAPTFYESGADKYKVDGDAVLSSPLECARTCRHREKPKICYYHFIVELYTSMNNACQLCASNVTNRFCNNCQCVTIGGVEQPIITVNRQIPGPSVEACQGDLIIIDLDNRIEGRAFTIHWHGLFQKGSPYYDGVPHVTQCPIESQTTFRYKFIAENPGTHFWHSHDGLSKLDGVEGTMIIRSKPGYDPNEKLYNYDLSAHVIMLSDWINEFADSKLPGRIRFNTGQGPNSFLINGKGRTLDPNTGNFTTTPLQVFHVKKNSRYRFRVINGFCTTCPSSLTIEGHALTMIATDGISFEPVVVDSLMSLSGERYDFVIKTNNVGGAYWIEVRGAGGCLGRRIRQLALLVYDDGPEIPPGDPPSLEVGLPLGKVMNPPDGNCAQPRDDAYCINHLKSAHHVDPSILGKPDVKLFLPFQFYSYTIQEIFKPNTFKKFTATRGGGSISKVGGISFAFPPSPLLSQYKDIPEELLCHGENLPADCGDNCTCVHVIKVAMNQIVELIIADDENIPNLHHPFHLHGYAYNVVFMGNALPNGTKITAKNVQELDRLGLIKRTKRLPPFKDTLPIPDGGVAIMRFRTNNPGYWLLHCHFLYHLITGMALVLHVGEHSDLPPVPPGFPKCGNHMNHIKW